MIRLIIGMILGILAVIFAVQNTETVTYTFLAWSIEMPRALTLIIVLIVGIGVGWVSTGLKRFTRKK